MPENKFVIFTEKIAYYVSAIEQDLEETLNELLSGNHRLHDKTVENLFNNEVIDRANEIKEIGISLGMQNIKKIKFPGFYFLRKSRLEEIGYRALKVNNLIIFVEILKHIYESIILIRMNINEIYKYPPFKKEAYIPNLILIMSSTIKNNLDSFFQYYGNENTVEDLKASKEEKSAYEEFRKTLSLSREALKELSGCKYHEEIEDNFDKTLSVYYAAIISNLESIIMDIVNIYRLKHGKNVHIT